MEKIIKLKKNNILKVPIQDENGKETGEFLEFDLEDIELPFKLEKSISIHNENLTKIKNELLIIDKRQDHKGKGLLTKNEEDKLKAMKEFYKNEIIALDLFIGEGGTKKLLNGRNPYFGMFKDITDELEPIMPYIKSQSKSIQDLIKEKYSKKEDNIL